MDLITMETRNVGVERERYTANNSTVNTLFPHIGDFCSATSK